MKQNETTTKADAAAATGEVLAALKAIINQTKPAHIAEGIVKAPTMKQWQAAQAAIARAEATPDEGIQMVAVSVQISEKDYEAMVAHFDNGQFGRPLIAVNKIIQRNEWQEKIRREKAAGGSK